MIAAAGDAIHERQKPVVVLVPWSALPRRGAVRGRGVQDQAGGCGGTECRA